MDAYTPPPPLQSQTCVVSCTGGEGPWGHPLIYLNLKPHGHTTCPYCSQPFIYVHPPQKGILSDL